MGCISIETGGLNHTSSLDNLLSWATYAPYQYIEGGGGDAPCRDKVRPKSEISRIIIFIYLWATYGLYQYIHVHIYMVSSHMNVYHYFTNQSVRWYWASLRSQLCRPVDLGWREPGMTWRRPGMTYSHPLLLTNLYMGTCRRGGGGIRRYPTSLPWPIWNLSCDWSVDSKTNMADQTRVTKHLKTNAIYYMKINIFRIKIHGWERESMVDCLRDQQDPTGSSPGFQARLMQIWYIHVCRSIRLLYSL